MCNELPSAASQGTSAASKQMSVQFAAMMLILCVFTTKLMTTVMFSTVPGHGAGGIGDNLSFLPAQQYQPQRQQTQGQLILTYKVVEK